MALCGLKMALCGLKMSLCGLKMALCSLGMALCCFNILLLILDSTLTHIKDRLPQRSYAQAAYLLHWIKARGLSQ